MSKHLYSVIFDYILTFNYLADSKPDHGLENIPVNLSSIKSKFETFQEEHHLPSTTDVCTLQRSASVMARLAK